MTRRWPDISKPRGNTSTNVAIGAGLGMLAGVIVLVIIGLVLATLFSVRPAKAHDSWISQGGYKNPAGEWCCGSYDCGVMIAGTVKPVAGGYEVDAVFRITYGGSITDDHVREFWPIHEATPSPDGAYWRCKKPDGSPRCRFVPPPGS